jgi:ProP effector
MEMEKRSTLTLKASLSKATKKQLAPLLSQKPGGSPQEKKTRIQETLKWLCDRYPECFYLKARRPLKKGIIDDLFSEAPEDGPSKTALRQALKYYTKGLLYKKALVEKQPRIDLRGTVVSEEFPEEEIAHAEHHIVLIKEKNKEKNRQRASQKKGKTEKVPNKPDDSN